MQCKECGTELPENARFCLQCGLPVAPDRPVSVKAPEPARPLPALSFVRPAATGGVFLFLVTVLAGAMLGNLALGLLILGGMLAAFLLNKQRPGGATFGDGAYAGVLSGLVGAVITTIVFLLLKTAAPPDLQAQQGALEKVLRERGIEGPAKDLLLRLNSPEISFTTVSITFTFFVLVFSLLATIGGMLGMALINRRMRGR